MQRQDVAHALEKQIVNPHTALGREDLQRLQALRFDPDRRRHPSVVLLRRWRGDRLGYD